MLNNLILTVIGPDGEIRNFIDIAGEASSFHKPGKV